MVVKFTLYKKVLSFKKIYQTIFFRDYTNNPKKWSYGIHKLYTRDIDIPTTFSRTNYRFRVSPTNLLAKPRRKARHYAHGEAIKVVFSDVQ